MGKQCGDRQISSVKHCQALERQQSVMQSVQKREKSSIGSGGIRCGERWKHDIKGSADAENAVVIARCSCVVSTAYPSLGGLVAHAGTPHLWRATPLASYRELPNLVPQGAEMPR